LGAPCSAPIQSCAEWQWGTAIFSQGSLALSRVLSFVSCPWLCPVSAAAARLCPALYFPPPGPHGPGYTPRPPPRPDLGAAVQACVSGWFRRGAGEMNPVLGRRSARTRRVSATDPVRVAAQRASPDFPAPAPGRGHCRTPRSPNAARGTIPPRERRRRVARTDRSGCAAGPCGRAPQERRGRS